VELADYVSCAARVLQIMGDQLKGGSGATPLNGQLHDVENGSHAHGPGKLLNLDTAVVAAPGQGNFWQRALWHGGSVYDAWLSASCAQVCTLYPHPGNTILLLFMSLVPKCVAFSVTTEGRELVSLV
jgi:hypothetical protein